MGNPFKSKKKTFVGTSVTRVVDDALVPNPLMEAILSTLVNDSDVTDEIKNSSLNNPVFRFERAYNYGLNGYIHGLPDTTLLTDDKGLVEAKAAIEAETGLTVTIEYLEYSPLNNVHMGWKWVTDNGYNAATNEIETLSGTIGFPVYLDSIIRLYSLETDLEADPDAWNEWDDSSFDGNKPTYQDIVSPQLTSRFKPRYPANEPEVFEGVKIGYIWVDGSGNIQEAEEVIDLSTYSPQASYFHAKYRYQVGNETTYRYWLYEDGAGTYPDLDALYKVAYSNPGTYFPFVPFRRGFTNLTNYYAGTSDLDSLVKMAGLYGIDYETMNADIHSNPDIGDVVSAAMLLGVPINSTNEVDVKYLHAFFLRLFLQKPNVDDVAVASGNKGSEYTDIMVRALNQTHNLEVALVPPTRYSLDFRDGGLSFNLKFGTVSRNTVVHSGQRGSYSLEVVPITYQRTVRKNTGTRKEPNYVQALEPTTVENVIIRYQITDQLCDELIVVNPSISYDVIGDYDAVANASSGNLLIPIDRSLSKQFSLIERNELYHRSMHFVFNSRKEYKVKWYQTGLFKAIVIIAAVAVTVITVGSGSGPAAALVAAVSAGVTATIIFLIKLLVYSLIIRYTFKIVAEKIGVEVAVILAVIAAVVAISSGNMNQPILEGGSTTWADTLLQVSNGLSVGSQLAIEDALKEVSNDLVSFNEYAEKRYDALGEANSLLDTGSLIDPLMLIERREPFTIFGEIPSDYFDRTIHTGNIGTVGYDLIENFVDTSLTLPKISQTLGVTYG